MPHKAVNVGKTCLAYTTAWCFSRRLSPCISKQKLLLLHYFYCNLFCYTGNRIRRRRLRRYDAFAEGAGQEKQRAARGIRAATVDSTPVFRISSPFGRELFHARRIPPARPRSGDPPWSERP